LRIAVGPDTASTANAAKLLLAHAGVKTGDVRLDPLTCCMRPPRFTKSLLFCNTTGSFPAFAAATFNCHRLPKRLAASNNPIALKGLLERLDSIEQQVVAMDLPDEYSEHWYILREHLAVARDSLLKLRSR